MPQIAQIGEIYASQLFWLTIFFGAMFIVVGLGMLPKIQSTVDARDSKIAADLAEAQKAREAAEDHERGYRERMDKVRADVARLVADAKANAAKSTEAQVREAEQAINARAEAANARIAEARKAAVGEIEGVAAEAASAMAERVAGLTLGVDEARAAVRQELAHG